MKIGVIGVGAIGTVLAKALENIEEIEEIWLFDRKIGKAVKVAKKLSKALVASSAKELIENVELVVESASQQAVREYSYQILSAGKDLLIMSVGAFVDSALRAELERVAAQKSRKIYLPSGAVLGIDGIKAAKLAKVDEVTLTTIKSPRAFEGNKYLKAKNIDVKKTRVLFMGSAEQAVKYFPENINVASCLALAGIGSEKTKVKIIADPKIKENIHRINVRGAFGEFKIEAKNVVCPDNPKTSYLAALSAIATIKKILEPFQIGT
ncbi:MAG: aspartate dehydrogenase [Candidatus Thermoplasmatota archaeon]|nr:aspartate dehydrogenase [Candidatus Thermoplasmatota archaeon]MDI6887061.1 aspartate dehydrogenase [Candidatus Thermoplasmatota archaeon]